jgi:hypothetical protein
MAAALLLAALPVAGQQGPPPNTEMVSVEVVGTKPGVVSLQTGGGWPLTIRLLANWPLGIATVVIPEPFPETTQRGFIVFADPDGCFSLSLEQLQGSAEACPGGRDETYLEFSPDLNVAGLEKSGNYDDPEFPPPPPSVLGLNTLKLPLGGPLSVPSWDGSPPEGNTARAYPGPPTGGDAKDNYGFGASPALPGLVVLSDTGVGNVWEDDVVGGELKGIRLVAPRRARNLAGFLNAAGLTLNDRRFDKRTQSDGRSSVTATFQVGRDLFKPVALIDWDFLDAGFRTAWRLDGGPLTLGTASLTPRSALDAHVTTLRIFVVSGTAPDELVDRDGDGAVTVADARAMGLQPLSDEEIVRFQSLHQEVEPALGIPFDFFGDGLDLPPAPAGGGAIRDVPR